MFFLFERLQVLLPGGRSHVFHVLVVESLTDAVHFWLVLAIFRIAAGHRDRCRDKVFELDDFDPRLECRLPLVGDGSAFLFAPVTVVAPQQFPARSTSLAAGVEHMNLDLVAGGVALGYSDQIALLVGVEQPG